MKMSHTRTKRTEARPLLDLTTAGSNRAVSMNVSYFVALDALPLMSRDSAVGIATGYGLDD
jgi:hypothetical protein